MGAELAQAVTIAGGALTGFVLVLARVGAVVALLPGFGEQTLPMRVRLLAALAFALVVWPAVAPALPGPGLTGGGAGWSQDWPPAGLIVIESVIGLVIGIAIRLIVLALQLAGSIAAQSTSITQIAGAAATPDPMPAMGNLLVMAGLALALVSGLHIKAAQAMIASYQVFPPGTLPVAGDLAQWGTARAADAFALALVLSAPFVLVSFAYNLALGFINRAMPALMVAFVGAPAIVAAALALMFLAGPAILLAWNARLDRVLAAPWALP